ncbi:MAG: class I SAM-dependent methyltransferase family protein [Promethearchaeota archaeon]
MRNNKKVKITYLKLKKKDGHKFFKFIKNNFNDKQLIDQKFKILHEKDYILFPIFQNQALINRITKKLCNQINFKIIYKEGIPNLNFKYKSLEKALNGKIPHKYAELIPKSYDIIGHIAILEFDKFNHINDKEFNYYKKKIAKAIIEVNKNIETVYEKKSQIRGEYRLRTLGLLYGEDKSETIYKENGCIFKLDIKNTFFSPRLVFERKRITLNKIEEKEIIIDMFAGIGTFSIQIAKNYNVKIHAFDLNPYAIKFLNKNIKMNKLKGVISSHHMDIKNILNSFNKLGTMLKHSADRVIMNLPEKSIDFIDVSCYLMKNSGGILHFYQISDKPNPIEKTVKGLEIHLSKFNWIIDKIFNSKIVKSYSPTSELVVIDLKIKNVNY